MIHFLITFLVLGLLGGVCAAFGALAASLGTLAADTRWGVGANNFRLYRWATTSIYLLLLTAAVLWSVSILSLLGIVVLSY